MPDIDFQRIVLNLIPKKGDEPVIFYASQYETSRPFIADLMWGDTEFTPGDDCWAEIDIRKVDDNLVVITDDVVIDNNEVSVVLPVQAVTCVGKNFGQLKIYADDDNMIAALNFILEVQPDPLAGGVTSETAIDNLETQIAAIVPEVIGDDYYDKTEVDALLADKADVSDLPDMSQYYTKTATDTLLNAKADKSDTYTKSQVDSALAAKANTADLATVATTGDYDDLLNKPTIPAAQIQSDYTQADTTAVDYIKNKPDIDAMIAAALLAVMPVDSATGNPCSFDTDIATSLVGLSADIVASGGGGTPSSPIPIVGISSLDIVRCGSNFLDISHLANKRFDGTASLNNVITENKIPIKGGVEYVWHTSLTDISGRYAEFYDNNDTYISEISLYGLADRTFTPPSNACSFRAMWYYGSGISPSDITEDCINVGSTALPYSPYNGQTFTIDLGGTRYGGYVDALRGKLRLTWGCIDLEDESLVWVWTNIWFQTESIPNIKYVSVNTQVGNALAEEFTIRMASGMSYAQVGECAIDISNVKFVTANSSTKPHGLFAYELATPIEIDVSAISVNAISGVNNISSNGNGDVTAQYKVSIQKYIDDHV